MNFFYNITNKTDKNYTVSILGLDETITIESDSVDETDIYLSAVALFEQYRKTRTAISLEQNPNHYDGYLDLPCSLEAQIHLLNVLLKERKRAVDLSKLMELSPQRVNKILSFTVTTDINTLQRALAVLGYRCELTITKI